MIPIFRSWFHSYLAGVVETTYYFIPWTVLVIFLFFGLLFDVLFTADSSFLFDPNYDNWRRRADSKYDSILFFVKRTSWSSAFVCAGIEFYVFPSYLLLLILFFRSCVLIIIIKFLCSSLISSTSSCGLFALYSQTQGTESSLRQLFFFALGSLYNLHPAGPLVRCSM